MESAINTYNKGLNRDISKNKYSPESYYDASNIQIVSDEATSTLAVTNEKGNSFSFSIPPTQAVYEITVAAFEPIDNGSSDAPNPDDDPPISYTLTINGVSKVLTTMQGTAWSYSVLYNQMITKFETYITLGHYRVFNQYDRILIVGLNSLSSIIAPYSVTVTEIVPVLNDPRIIGYKQLRDGLVVLTTTYTGLAILDAPIDSASNGQIWYVPINSNGSITELTAEALTPSLHLKYNNQLNFDINYRPEIIANYESPEIGKIYWTDNNNNFRHFNVLDANSLAIRLNSLEIVPDIKFGRITLNSVSDTGTYKSGMVQYAYQYYNLHGSQSAYSPTSGLVHLVESSESLPNSTEYFGSAKDRSTGKAISLTITNLDKSFTNIRTVALFYTTKEGTPEITVIDDREVPQTSNSITILDSGNLTKSTVTLVEFTLLGSVNFKCKTIETKDNILFPANIEEDFFDIGSWDGRAYRFGINGECVVKDANGSISDINSINFNLPSTHDAIQTKSDQLTYKYLHDGTRLGGEGKNVKYYFGIKTLVEDDHALSNDSLGAPNSNGYTNYANSVNAANYVGYQRDEVYRFGVIFRDNRGRKSFVTWIADIKMPAIYESDVVSTYTINGEVDKYDFATFYKAYVSYINVLHPIFEVSNWPTGAISYEIVRLKREETDKTILAQGIILGVNTNEADVLYGEGYPVNANDVDTKLVLFNSPEVSFYKKTFNGSSLQPIFYYLAGTNGDLNKITYKCRDLVQLSAQPSDSTTQEMLDQRVILPGYEQRVVINNNVPLSGYRYHAGEGVGYLGTTLAAGTDVTFRTLVPILAIPEEDDDEYFIAANVVKNLGSQYGGNTYSDRYNNKYISCGATGFDTSYLDVYGGDIYIGYFDQLYGFIDVTSEGSTTYFSSVKIFFPVETSINLALRHDICFSKGANSYLINEKAGSYVVGEDSFHQTTDLYLYNTVYSKENDTINYFSKPVNFSTNKKFDTRILSSKSKITNEEIDSWTYYLATNYIDTDGAYGPVNKLITFNNRLYFYQNRAFGWLNVNERSLTAPDVSGSTLALGKGGILDQSFYISRYSGTKHQFSVIGTPNGLYSYDAANSKLNLFNGENSVSLSESRGLASLLKNFTNPLFKATDKTLLKIGVHGVYDVRFNRVLWTFKDDSSINEMTVSYNEMLGSFESFYDYKPCIYGIFDDKLFSVDPEHPTQSYLHNIGNRGEFYGLTHDSFITLLFNKDPHQIKLVTNLEYLLATYPDECQNFKEIIIWNDYQSTGDVTLTSDNSRRLMRRWRFTVPRDIVNNSDARIRSEYVFIKLLYENKNNKKFLLFDMITHYIPRA